MNTSLKPGPNPVPATSDRPLAWVFTATLAVASLAGEGTRAFAEAAQAQPELIASPEPDWPQWRGPNRDGRSAETGLLREWPEGGPPRIWQATGLGRGYSTPIVVGERLYLAGDFEDELRVHALDLAGRPVWSVPNGRPWRTPYPGARAACTYSEGRIYHLNAHGRLACLDAETGKELWHVELFEQFGGKNITWALSECLLVDGDRVIATPGGTRALMVALDKRTGQTLWKTESLRLGPSPSEAQERLADPAGETDNASYASPILIRLGNQRQLVSCSLRHAFGVDADTGRLLWTRPYPTRYQVIAATPLLVNDAVFVTAPDTVQGGVLLRLLGKAEGPGVETVWRTPLDTCHGGLVLVGDSLYGSWYRKERGWARVDARTGQVRYSLRDLAKGSILYADDRLYCLSEEGEMALLEPLPDRFEFRGRFPLITGRANDVWAHPVIHQGRLFLRHHETLSAFDIRQARAERK